MVKNLGRKMIQGGCVVLLVIYAVISLGKAFPLMPDGIDWDRGTLAWTTYSLCGSVESVNQVSSSKNRFTSTTKVKFNEDSTPFVLEVGTEETLEVSKFYQMTLRQYPADSAFVVMSSKEVPRCTTETGPSESGYRIRNSIVVGSPKVNHTLGVFFV